MKCAKEQLIWALLRLSMGWIFLWSFFDKLIGLGFATKSSQSWLSGGSPTFGFLSFATKGPFVDFYKSIAGNPVVDWLFMLGLLGVGVSLFFGVFIKLGSFIGILMLILIYAAGSLPPANNPFLDEHIVYIVIMIGLITTNSSQCCSAENWLSNFKKHKT